MTKKTKKKPDTNVVPFTFPDLPDEDENERQLSHDEMVEWLVENVANDVEFDRIQNIKAVEWGTPGHPLKAKTMEMLWKHAKRLKEYRAPKPEPDIGELEKRCRTILDTEGILDLWMLDWDRMMAGEHRNAKLLYLVATSRLFEQGMNMHAAIKGQSSAGKSGIRGAVLKFFPENDVIDFALISEKALFWWPGGEYAFTRKI